MFFHEADHFSDTYHGPYLDREEVHLASRYLPWNSICFVHLFRQSYFSPLKTKRICFM
jgi:hypothetical protein